MPYVVAVTITDHREALIYRHFAAAVESLRRRRERKTGPEISL